MTCFNLLIISFLQSSECINLKKIQLILICQMPHPTPTDRSYPSKSCICSCNNQIKLKVIFIMRASIVTFSHTRCYKQRFFLHRMPCGPQWFYAGGVAVLTWLCVRANCRCAWLYAGGVAVLTWLCVRADCRCACVTCRPWRRRCPRHRCRGAPASARRARRPPAHSCCDAVPPPCSATRTTLTWRQPLRPRGQPRRRQGPLTNRAVPHISPSMPLTGQSFDCCAATPW